MRQAINITAVMLLVAAGCSQFVTRRYVEYADTYTATINGVADLVRAGKIDPEDGRRIQAYSKVIRAQMAKFREAIARGEKREALTIILDTIRDALRQLALEIDVAKEKR